MKKQEQNAPAYRWESPAVRAALEGKGWLWVSIQTGQAGKIRVADWYPPRIARYIMSMLREAGSCQPANEWWAYQVVLAGPNQAKAHFGHYAYSKLTALLWGLHFYHRRVNRALTRRLKRNRRNILDSGLLGRTEAHTIEAGQVVARPAKKPLD